MIRTTALLLCLAAGSSAATVQVLLYSEGITHGAAGTCQGCARSIVHNLSDPALLQNQISRFAEISFTNRFGQSIAIDASSVLEYHASPGVLKGLVQGEVIATGSELDGGSGSPYVLAGAQVSLAYSDRFRIGSDTLAPGTWVDLRVTGRFDHSGEAIGSTSRNGVRHTLFIPGGVHFNLTHPNFLYVPPATFTDVIKVRVGQWYDVHGRLEIYANSTFGGEPGQWSAIVDAANSSYTFLDPLTPGVFLESESGFNYSSVPEPGTAILMAASFSALLVFRRHRKL
jgi:hypothetical protein